MTYLLLAIIAVLSITIIYIRNERDMMWVRREDHLKILEEEIDLWIPIVEKQEKEIKELKGKLNDAGN